MTTRVGLLALVVAMLIGVAAPAFAQTTIVREAPGLEQQRFRERAPPQAAPRGPMVEMRATMPPEEAETVRLKIRRIVIEGATVYSDAQLAPLYGELLGAETTLKAVYDLAQRITAKYGSDGYALSRAIVPPQRLSRHDATIRLRVVEGYVDRVEWPAALSKYRDFYHHWEAKILADRPANVRSLERYLLLGNDLPGIKLRSTLKPSDANSGAATLVVEMTEKPVDLQTRIDNRGTKARGPYQYLMGATFNNLLHAHESLGLTYAGTFQTGELQYGAAQFRQVLTPEGLAANVSVSYATGKPGTSTLRALSFQTHSLIFEAGLSYPIIRSREQNLTISGLFFASNSRGSFFDPTLDTNDRLRGTRFRLDYDVADRLAGVTQISTTASFGFDALGAEANSRAGGALGFSKLEGSIGRMQPLGNGFSTYLALEGQTTGQTLFAPEECGYGGRGMGRAFDPSELTGDSCWAVSGELRYNIPLQSLPKARVQLYGFLDHGQVYRRHPAVGRAKDEEGSSAGIGTRLGWSDQFHVDLLAAKPIDGRVNDDWRFFFTLVGRY